MVVPEIQWQKVTELKKLQVGMLLKNEDKKIMIVGHVNELGGLCDDCPLKKEDIVEFSTSLIECIKGITNA